MGFLDPPGLFKGQADSLYVGRSAFQGIRSRDFPGPAAFPTVNTAPGTQVLSAAGASSSITSFQQIRPTHTVFRVLHGQVARASSYPDYLGWRNTWTSTTSGGWAVEFDLDTVGGVFEVLTKGDGAKLTVLINGQYLAASAVTVPAGGALYNLIVTLSSGGFYRVRIELDGQTRFFGVNVGPTDAVYAAPRRPIRAAWVGDSFSEPTISDSGGSHHGQGMVPMFGWATGWDVYPAGRGGTGFMNPGTYVKYADRLPEILAVPNLDIVIFQLSGNDVTYTTAQVVAQVQACITLARAAGFVFSNQIIVMSSWWNKQSQGMPAALIDQNNQVQALCATLGIPFVDTLIPAVSNGVSSTVATAITSGQSQLVIVDRFPSVADSPAGNLAGGEYFVQIGNSGSSALEVRQVQSVSGSGPYTLGLTSGVGNTHAVGESVIQVGKGVLTGTGYQGATTGSGSSDRFTGTDGTHPTVAGARWRGAAYAARLQQIIPR
jgi:lysophospholipase L1-like esterase